MLLSPEESQLLRSGATSLLIDFNITGISADLLPESIVRHEVFQSQSVVKMQQLFMLFLFFIFYFPFPTCMVFFVVAFLLEFREGRPGMFDVIFLSGISGLSFLSPLLFFLPSPLALSCHFSVTLCG